MNFKEKIVLITGSTRGIGRQVAHSFADQGATVIITGRNQETAQKVAAEITANGGSADGFACNVSDFQNVQEVVDKVLDKHTRIDILINNAGITKDGLLMRMSEADWDDVIEVNLKGLYNFTKTVSKVMLKQKAGKMINISSVIGLMGNIGQANYAASKAGMIGFTKSMARELASRGINVNAIAPGYIQTEMTDEMTDKARDAILAQIPLKTFGQTADVANVCLFLASEKASYITGQTLVVDGGMSL